MRATTDQVEDIRNQLSVAVRNIQSAQELTRLLELPAECDRFHAAANCSLKYATPMIIDTLRDLASIGAALHKLETSPK